MPSEPRVDVRKTYKLFIGGAFPRSESGRTYVVEDAKGRFLANAALASRKDARDAVGAARKAFAGWSGRTPYNRGQVVYRVAEMLEGRRAQFADEVARSEGITPRRADGVVSAAVDRLVWYAGWADKVAQVVGSSNPVAGPYFDFSLPEPTGVVGLSVPERPALLGLVSHVLPAIVSGNTVVALLSEADPLPGLEWAEVLATSDLPKGVVNLLSGRKAEMLPHLARHMDVNALALASTPDPLAVDALRDAAVNVKRTKTYSIADYHSAQAQGLDFLKPFLEIKTTWHPVGW